MIRAGNVRQDDRLLIPTLKVGIDFVQDSRTACW